MDSIAYNSQSHQLFTNNIGWTPSPATVNHTSYSPTTLDGLHHLQQPITLAIHQQDWVDSISYNSQSHQLFTNNIEWTPSPTTTNHKTHQLFTNNIGWTPPPTTANHISYSPTTLNGLYLLQQPITSAIHQQHWMDSIACNSQSHQLFTNNIERTPSPTTANYISYSPTTLDGLHRLQQPITPATHQEH